MFIGGGVDMLLNGVCGRRGLIGLYGVDLATSRGFETWFIVRRHSGVRLGC